MRAEAQRGPHWQALPCWQPHWQALAAAGADDWQPQVQAAPTQFLQLQDLVFAFMAVLSLVLDGPDWPG
jgi:hypothetical protein